MGGKIVLNLAARFWMIAVLIGMSSGALAGRGTLLGTAKDEQGEFDPQPNPFVYRDSSYSAFRLEMRLSQPEPPGDWKISISSGGQKATYSRDSLPAADGTFMSPLLDPRNIIISVPPGAPSLLVSEKIGGRDFGRSLSIYSDDEKPFTALTEVIAQNGIEGASAGRFERAARGMVWIGMEDKVSTDFEGCSGFLVTKNLILTARHCLTSDTFGQGDLTPKSDLVVRVWLRDFTSSRDMAPTFDNVRVVWPTPDEARRSPSVDAALLRIPRDIGTDLPIKIFSGPVATGTKLQILEFPGRAALSVPTNLSNCYVIGSIPQLHLMEHECNTDSGSSGSPIFKSNLEEGAVAIQVQGWLQDPSEENRGVFVEEILHAVRSDDPDLYMQIKSEQEGIKW
jgi:hypothetical protein